MKADDKVYPLKPSHYSDGLAVRDYIAIHSQNSVTLMILAAIKNGDTSSDLINRPFSTLCYERADAMIEKSND